MARQARHRGKKSNGAKAKRSSRARGRATRPKTPRWDQELHELWWGNVLVKRFREPANEQEIILASFEESGWPARIDDPLPPRTGIDPKARLHDTIKRLNRAQTRRLIQFSGDGTGKGVRWQKRERP